MPDSPANDRLDRYARVIARIDGANGADPSHEIVDGTAFPKAVLYGMRMTRWLARIAPDASEALRIAVRAQHLERWTIPRDRYPEDRAGYLRWRSRLAEHHADAVASMMHAEGYSLDEIGRVGSLVQKRNLKIDPEAQTLEDVACLVFLENYCAEFAAKQSSDKVVDIVAKTWRKMSPAARDAAAALTLPDGVRWALSRALPAFGDGSH